MWHFQFSNFLTRSTSSSARKPSFLLFVLFHIQNFVTFEIRELRSLTHLHTHTHTHTRRKQTQFFSQKISRKWKKYGDYSNHLLLVTWPFFHKNSHFFRSPLSMTFQGLPNAHYSQTIEETVPQKLIFFCCCMFTSFRSERRCRHLAVKLLTASSICIFRFAVFFFNFFLFFKGTVN